MKLKNETHTYTTTTALDTWLEIHGEDVTSFSPPPYSPYSFHHRHTNQHLQHSEAARSFVMRCLQSATETRTDVGTHGKFLCMISFH